MIQVKFVYDNREFLKMKREGKLLQYKKEDFDRMIQEKAGGENKKPPFRDVASARFIREIDHARFAEDDWYSVDTLFGRIKLADLCGGTKYALTVIDNSQRGIYTSFRSYEKDIWSRLAEMPFDALIFYLVSDLNTYSTRLPFPDGIEDYVVIENYRHDGTEMEAYLCSYCTEGQEFAAGKLHVENHFEELCFDPCRDFDLLINKAEDMLKQINTLQSRLPLIMSVEQFAKTLNESCMEYLCSYLNGTNALYEDIKRFLKGLTIHNYMDYIVEHPYSDSPMYIVIKKNRHTGEYTVTKECGCKYHDIGHVLVEDFLRLSDKESGDYEKLTIVIDAELFWHGENELEYALWAFKMHDNIAELYDGNMIFKELVDFVRGEDK